MLKPEATSHAWLTPAASSAGRSRLPGIGLLWLVAALTSLAAAWAQEPGKEPGVVTGAVRSGAAGETLPGVRITIQGAKLTAYTSADGTYHVEGVPAGVYDLHFELAGFVTVTSHDVEIEAGETTEVNASMKLLFAHEMTITARRDETSLQQVSENVEVLTAAEIEQLASTDLYGALNTILGVDVDTQSSLSRTGTFLYVDGYSDVYVRKMVDGVDVGQVVSNWSLLNAYPEEMVEQVDVIKGGSSSVWGSNMGGIVNVITKRPTDLERTNVSVNALYSDYGEMDFADADAIPASGDFVSFGASVQDSFEDSYYMAGYSRHLHDGFVEDGEENNYNLFGKYGRSLGSDSTFDALYSYNKVGANGHAFRTAPAGSPLPFVWNYFQATDAVSQMGSLKYASQSSSTFGFEVQAKYNRMVYDSFSDYFEGASSNLGPPNTTATTSFLDQKVGGTFKSSYRPSENLSFVSGIDYYRIKADFSDFIADQPIIEVDSTAPFANLSYERGDLGLHVGARYDDDSSFGSQLSPSLGLHYQLASATMIRANVARTFRVPPLWYTLGASFLNFILPNPDLDPERAWAYSAGFETQQLRYLYLKLSYYHHDMEDGIVAVPNPDGSFTFTWSNATDFERKGYETEVGVLVPGGLVAYFGYNKNDHNNEIADSVVNGIPTIVKKAGLKFRHEGLDLLANLRGRWIYWNLSPTSSFYPNEDQKWLFDLRVAKGFRLAGQELTVALDVFNLTDELYWNRADFPNPRRWVALGVNYRIR